ncbi:hypothetical protein M758_6G159600 [Ceratodon purpureus]|nr:hypothetical protein M758_6G159600 [Ceratodon purpureus]
MREWYLETCKCERIPTFQVHVHNNCLLQLARRCTIPDLLQHAYLSDPLASEKLKNILPMYFGMRNDQPIDSCSSIRKPLGGRCRSKFLADNHAHRHRNTPNRHPAQSSLPPPRPAANHHQIHKPTTKTSREPKLQRARKLITSSNPRSSNRKPQTPKTSLQ